MERILVIKHGALGDFVLQIGSMMALKEKHPEAHFSLLTSSPYVQMAKQMGMFSEIIVDNRRSPVFLLENIRVLRAVLGGKFDIIYDFQGTQRAQTYRKLWKWLMPAGEYVWHVAWGTLYRLSKKCRWCWKIEEEKVAPPRRMTNLLFMHGEEKYFHMLPERYVMLIPGCSPQHPHKRWPVESFREIVRRLAERGISSVVIGTKAEQMECDAICRDMPLAVNMVGRTQMMDIPQVAHRALAVLGNDTGPTHMSAFSGVHTIGVYDKRHCRGILRGPDCTNLVSEGVVGLISPDEVWKHLEPHLERKDEAC